MNWLPIASILMTLVVAALHLLNTSRIFSTQQEIKKIDALKVDVKDFQKELSCLQAFTARADQKLEGMNGNQLRDLQTEQARQSEQIRMILRWIEKRELKH